MIKQVVGLIVSYWLTPVYVRAEDIPVAEIHWETDDGSMGDIEVMKHADMYLKKHIEEVKDDHHEMMQKELQTAQNPFEEYRDMDDDMQCGGKCKCKACIFKGAAFIMKGVAKRIAGWCSHREEDNTTMELCAEGDVECHRRHHKGHCPHKRRICAAFKKRPKAFLGYLAVKMRPIEFSMGYCTGAGYCGRGHKAHELLYSGVSHEQMKKRPEVYEYVEPSVHPEYARGCSYSHKMTPMMKPKKEEEPFKAILGRKLSLKSGLAKLKAFFTGKKEEEEVDENGFSTDDKQMFDDVVSMYVDPAFDSKMETMKLKAKESGEMRKGADYFQLMDTQQCYKNSVSNIMGEVAVKVAQMCKVMGAKNEVVGKMCGFAEQNKEAVLGMMMAQIEPMKMAMGACAAKKSDITGNPADDECSTNSMYAEEDEEELCGDEDVECHRRKRHKKHHHRHHHKHHRHHHHHEEEETTMNLRGGRRQLNPADGSNNGPLKHLPGVPEKLWLPGDEDGDAERRGDAFREIADHEQRIEDAKKLDKTMKNIKTLPKNEEEAKKKFGEPRMGIYEAAERQRQWEEDMKGNNKILTSMEDMTFGGPQWDTINRVRDQTDLIPIPDGAPDNFNPPMPDEIRFPDKGPSNPF